MIVSKDYVEDLRKQIKDLHEENQRLVNAICAFNGIPAPFTVPFVKQSVPVSGRKSWLQRQKELEAQEILIEQS